MFQHKYYPHLGVLFGLVLPTLIASLWGDALGGFLWAGYISRLLTWHATFCINSLAHYAGTREFSQLTTARGNFLLALITCGEGFHNFHHEFPVDYRNGIRWYDWDPSKWAIQALAAVGLAWGLKEARVEDMEKAKLVVRQAELDQAKRKFNWGPKDAELPVWTREKFARESSSDPKRILININSYVHDLTKYAEEHPGGIKILSSRHDQDASDDFDHIINKHTQAARTLAMTMRIAKIDD